jgi:hypothetical protein
LCFEVGHVGLGGDGQLWDILHVLFHGVHVVYVTHQGTATVFCEVAQFSTVEAGAFESRAAWFFLRLCSCCVGAHVIALILSTVVGCPGVRYVHGHWDIVICQSWGIGGIVGQPLLLLLLLLWPHLLAVTPAMRLELVPVLTKCIIEGARVWQTSPGSNELYHLFAFGDVDSFLLVFVVGRREWAPYDFI